MASRRSRRRFHDRDSDEFDPDGRDGAGAGPETSWQHEVDLHGCTVESAERRLLTELTRCRAAGRTPVLVITGKGYGSHGGQGVLGPAIKKWLNGPGGARVGVSGLRSLRAGGAYEVALTRTDR